MKKQIKLLSLLLALLMLAPLCVSCSNGGGTSAVEETTAAPVETEPPFDMSAVTGTAYGKMVEGVVTLLTFDGTNATLSTSSLGKNETVTGAFSGNATSFTIGDKSYDYLLDGKTLKLSGSGSEYELNAADENAAAAYQKYVTILGSAWTGDGLSLSFNDDGSASLKIDAAAIDYSGDYKLNSNALTVKNTAAGEPVNYALNAACDCSSLESGATYAAAMAFDGDTSTRFSSAYKDPSWLSVDLGEAKAVSAVRCNWEAAAGADYNIEVSDDNENWTPVVEVVDNTEAGELEYSFPSVTTRYVRMYGTKRATEYGYSLYEFEVLNFIIGAATCKYEVQGADTLILTIGENAYTFKKA